VLSYLYKYVVENVSLKGGGGEEEEVEDINDGTEV